MEMSAIPSTNGKSVSFDSSITENAAMDTSYEGDDNEQQQTEENHQEPRRAWHHLVERLRRRSSHHIKDDILDAYADFETDHTLTSGMSISSDVNTDAPPNLVEDKSLCVEDVGHPSMKRSKHDGRKVQGVMPAKPRRRSLRTGGSMKLPKHTVGLEWMRVFKHRLQQLNQQFSSNFNIVFLSLESSWRWLTLFYFASVFLVAIVLSALFFNCGCHEHMEYGKILLLVAQQLVAGPSFIEASDIGLPDLPSGCILLGFVSSTFTIIFQAFLLSMAVRKLMKPRAAISFSRKLVVNTRNGVPCLQARIMNLRGNLITNVQIVASRSRRVETQEGEVYFAVDELTFTGPKLTKFPGVYSHYIDEKSPLYEEYHTKHMVSGFLWLEVIGYDAVLTEEVHQIWMFELPNDVAPCARFHDMVVKGSAEAIRDKTYTMVVDMAHFNRVVHTHPPSQCCLLCRKGCAFGSGAKLKAVEQHAEDEQKQQLLDNKKMEEPEEAEKVEESADAEDVGMEMKLVAQQRTRELPDKSPN
eukprot:m.76443 g.76443  ORF g.76443 m.76443 type:complete len:527 (-) comp14026_c0_seq2:667-2247(-)